MANNLTGLLRKSAVPLLALGVAAGAALIVISKGYTKLDGNTRRAIDFHESETIDEEALKALVRAAVTLNASKAKR
jgi:hypothetical protein